MSKKVFPLYRVGTFFNNNFVNVKMDAETGEGLQFAKKYNVRLYPSYVFIDPKTENVIHRGKGNQSPDNFIFIGESALNTETTSVFLEKEIAQGNETPELLLNYAKYSGVNSQKKEVLRVLKRLSDFEGYGLENQDVWSIFVSFVRGIDNSLFNDFVSKLEKYKSLYGDEIVDRKLYNEYMLLTGLDDLENAPPFEGKQVIKAKIQVDRALSEKNYNEASGYVDSLFMLSEKNLKEVCFFLSFLGRSNLYNDFPEVWHDKCLDIAKFLAYNNDDRDDAFIHFLYAKQLELKLKRSNISLKSFKYGTNEYSLRDPQLKPKPN